MANNLASRIFQSPNGVSDVERGLAGVAVRNQSANPAIKLAQAPTNAKPTRASKIDVLVCTEFPKISKTWSSWVYSGRKCEVVQIDSWPQLAKSIERFGRINELILGFHGHPDGSVEIGGEVYRLDHTDLAALFKNAANIATNIEFLSCTVGLSPQVLGTFARLMGARTIVGWTQFFGTSPFDLNLTGSGDAEKIAAFIGRYSDYLPLNFPKTKEELDKAIRRLGPKPKVLPGVLEWFSFSPEIALMVGFPAPNHPDFEDEFDRATNRKNPRLSAQEINIKGSDLSRPIQLDMGRLNRVKVTMDAA